MTREKQESVGLLEYCMEQTGCIYLSDLHNCLLSKHLKRVVKGVPAERYSSHEWVDALNYIAGTHDTKSISAQEARQTLLTALGRDQAKTPGLSFPREPAPSAVFLSTTSL